MLHRPAPAGTGRHRSASTPCPTTGPWSGA